MVWNKFLEEKRTSQTCASTLYLFNGDWENIPLAVRDALAERNFTKEKLEKCQACWASGSPLPPFMVKYLGDVFDSWKTADGFDDDLVKGDVSEISFCTLRQVVNSGKPVIQRTKQEALSSRTAGWDLIEIFFDTDPWYILWEIKGTDKHPESQSRSAAKQVINRCGPWLAKLSKLLEAELAVTHGKTEAEFAGKLHDFFFKQGKEFNIGVAVVVDERYVPKPDFEMFEPQDQELTADRQWGVIMGMPNYLRIRQEVVKWMLVH
jgi:hypothetical protein